VRFHRWPTDRVWTRDSGCAFVFPSAAAAPVREPGPGANARSSGKEHSARPQAVPTRRVATERATAALSAVKWRFHPWPKYPNWRRGEKIGSLMAQVARAEEIQPTFANRRIVLEGGSIDVNGSGTLITTEECLLSRVQQRNPGMKKRDYERVFAKYLGVQNVIWLGCGVVGDDTHGHVDDITRFVSHDTVVTCVDA